MFSMFRTDTEVYKPTATNIVKENMWNKWRQRVKPLVRVMKDDTHTYTQTNLLSRYKEKKLSFLLKYFNGAENILGLKKDRQHFAKVFWLLDLMMPIHLHTLN
jgi:hypothetical protein